jgi:hypothetical protein
MPSITARFLAKEGPSGQAGDNILIVKVSDSAGIIQNGLATARKASGEIKLKGDY